MLSGLSRIFRKPFANVHISRKVAFAHVWQIYACGPRSCKTFHGFLHDVHVEILLLSARATMAFVRRTGCGIGATLPCARTAAPLAPQPIGFEVGSESTLVSINWKKKAAVRSILSHWRIDTASDIRQIVEVH